jgi:putative two-component system response regulator
MDKTILLVDDDPAVLGVLKECLRPHYQIRIATTGGKALELSRTLPLPDLILLDVRLPDMAGYEVCATLKQDEQTKAIPVIFLSSHSDVVNITHGLEIGAVDYVTKPVAPPILLARVQTHLRLRDQSVHLEDLVRERTLDLQTKTEELLLSQELTIVALGSLAETRDNETGNHIQRTRAYVEAMAGRLAVLPRYRDSISPAEWEMMWRSAPLHDLGKVGIPDHILLKPGKLTVEEFEVMKRHPVIGRDALRAAEFRAHSTDGSILRVAGEIAYSHHERWDGTGYPEGMSGEEIPLSARLMALADVYDALISKRVYKAAMSHSAAIEIIREGRAKHFDPQIVDCFLEDVDEFRYIASRFSDDDPNSNTITNSEAA